MRLFLAFILFVAFSAAVRAATVFGTPNSDILFFDGASQAVSTTLTNPYDSATFIVNGTYYVNQASYDGLADEDTLLFTNVADFMLLDDGGTQTVLNMERFVLGDGDDVLNLASTTFILGNIFADGGLQNDLIWGNSGNDTLQGAAGNDILDGGPGNDILRGQADNDALDGGSGNNQLNGGDGTDTANFGAFGNYLIVRISANQVEVDCLDLSCTNLLTDVEFAHFTSGSTVIDLSTLPITGPIPEPTPGELVSVAGCVLWACRRWRSANN